MTERIGRQTPTRSRVIPYSKTYGIEAIELYNTTGSTAMEWQQLQVCLTRVGIRRGVKLHLLLRKESAIL